jgi:hypothetical protein
MFSPVSAIVCFAIGLMGIVFRHRIARVHVQLNYRILGIRYNPRSFVIAYLVGGILAILSGIVEMLFWLKAI